MAYQRQYQRRKRLTSKRVYVKKPTARNQQKQIATLAGKVNRISRGLRDKRNYGQFVTPITSTSLSGDLNVFPLTNIQQWGQVFSDPDIIKGKNRFNLLKCNIDMLIQPYNEEAIISMTIFVVSLQPEVARKVLVETSNLTPGSMGNSDYRMQNGLCMLNQGRYKIHYCKRMETWNYGVNNNLPYGAMKRIYKRIPFRKTISSETGNWLPTVTNDEVAADSRLYILAFNNNSAADLKSPTLEANVIWTGWC